MLLQAQTSATATFAQRRLREMRIEGFFDPQHTRSVRVRLLTYNNGLARPLLCAITIEAYLGPAGVLITRTSTASVPVVEYMPASEVQELVVESFFLIWTAAQMIKELFEFGGSRTSLAYFSDVYNFLDWARFFLIVIALIVRVTIQLDTSRSFNIDSEEYIDVEWIINMHDYYRLLSCVVLLLATFSTVQYFNLVDSLRAMKGTLGRSGAELIPFGAIFCFFFFAMTLIGMLLFGQGFAEYADYYAALSTAFAMMIGENTFDLFNSNIPRDDGEITIKYAAALIYYGAFVFLLFFVLLNMVIAIVVDAYMAVKEQGRTKVATLLKKNVGPVLEDTFIREWARLNYWFGADETFVPWSDAEWISLLETVLSRRFYRGMPSTRLRLTVLAREIREIRATSARSADETSEHASETSEASYRRGSAPLSLYLTNAKPAPTTDGTEATPRPEQLTPRSEPPPLHHTSASCKKLGALSPSQLGNKTYQVADRARLGAKRMRGAVADAAATVGVAGAKGEGPMAARDVVFMQTAARFYHRPYFVTPGNLNHPFDEELQPSSDTWMERTMHQTAAKVDKMDARTIELAVQIQNLHALIASATGLEADTVAAPSSSSQRRPANAVRPFTSVISAPSDTEMGEIVREVQAKCVSIGRTPRRLSAPAATSSQAPERKRAPRPAHSMASSASSEPTADDEIAQLVEAGFIVDVKALQRPPPEEADVRMLSASANAPSDDDDRRRV